MRTTVIIDDSRPEAKALIEYLRTLNYVEIIPYIKTDK